MDIKLDQTCGACPEQYDMYINGEMVAYFRLRHGYFRVEMNSECVYEANTKGDGMFDDDERDFHMRSAIRAVLERVPIRYSYQRSNGNG